MTVNFLKTNKPTGLIFAGVLLSSIAILPKSYNPYLVLKAPILILFLGMTLFFLREKISINDIKKERNFVLGMIFFLTSLTVSGLLSSANSNRIFWGEYDRKNGLYSYLALSLLILVMILIRNELKVLTIFSYIYASAFIMSIYFLCQSLGLNLLNEKFVYGPIVGFFGNPNFTSAFLGIMCAFPIGYIFSKSHKKLPHILVLFFFIALIKQSGSIQGFLLVASSLSLFSILKIMDLKQNRVAVIATSVSILIIGATSLLGLLGLGPLSSFLFRTSAKIRVGYFESAIEMFKSKPLIGIGTDSYGDFFRQFRPDWLIEMIGDGTTNNDAHNVFLHLLSTSGVITFTIFTILNLYCLYRGIRGVVENPKSLELQIIVVGFSSYLLQSLLSINNLGLAIWGWFFMGMILLLTSKKAKLTDSRISSSKPKILKLIGLVSGMALVVLASIGFLRASEEVKLRNYTTNLQIDGSQSYRESKFNELASISNYWINDVTPSLAIQNAFLVLGASEAAEIISRETYRKNPDSRDALWALVEVTQRRGNLERVVELRETLILKEKRAPWVLLEQADTLIRLGRSSEALPLVKEAEMKGADAVRLKEIKLLLTEG